MLWKIKWGARGGGGGRAKEERWRGKEGKGRIKVYPGHTSITCCFPSYRRGGRSSCWCCVPVCSEWGWILWGHGPHLFIGFVLHLGVSGQEIQREQQLLRYLEQDHCIDWNNEIQHEHQLMCRLEQGDTARTATAASSGTRKYSTNSICCVVWNKEIQHEQQLLHRLEQGNTARTASAVSSGTRKYSTNSNCCIVWNKEIQYEQHLLCRLEQGNTARTATAASSGTRKYSTNSICCVI